MGREECELSKDYVRWGVSAPFCAGRRDQVMSENGQAF